MNLRSAPRPVVWHPCSPPPSPRPSGAEVLEAPKAPKKNFGLNELAPNTPEKIFDQPKARGKFWPNVLGGLGGWGGGSSVRALRHKTLKMRPLCALTAPTIALLRSLCARCVPTRGAPCAHYAPSVSCHYV